MDAVIVAGIVVHRWMQRAWCFSRICHDLWIPVYARSLVALFEWKKRRKRKKSKKKNAWEKWQHHYYESMKFSSGFPRHAEEIFAEI